MSKNWAAPSKPTLRCIKKTESSINTRKTVFLSEIRHFSSTFKIAHFPSNQATREQEQSLPMYRTRRESKMLFSSQDYEWSAIRAVNSLRKGKKGAKTQSRVASRCPPCQQKDLFSEGLAKVFKKTSFEKNSFWGPEKGHQHRTIFP